MPKKFDDPVSELGLILSGSSMENLKSILADPGADMSPGDLAVASEALSQIAGEMKEAAKEIVLSSTGIAERVGAHAKFVDSGAVFTHLKGGETTSVDTAAVRKLFPPDKEPSLYKTTIRRPFVKIEIAR